MNKKYTVYSDNRLMARKTTRKQAEKLATALPKGSYGSKLPVTHEPNGAVWAFLNKKEA